MQGPTSRRWRVLRGALPLVAGAALLAGCGGGSSTTTTVTTSAPATSAASSSSSTASAVAGVSISATPNPVPNGSGAGTTTVQWSSAFAKGVEIKVSFNGTAPRLFAKGGKSGSTPANFIVAGNRYKFMLYDVAHPTSAAGSVLVTRK